MSEADIPAARAAPRSRVTIADVAALAGVSRGAVSKAFNGTGHISAATTERIRDAAKKLNWTPSVTAAALRSSKSRNVGLVLNRPGALEIGATSSLLISGLESVLAPLGYGLLLYIIDRNAEDEASAYRAMVNERRVDGVVLTDSRVSDSRFSLIRSLGLPAVLVGTPAEGSQIAHLDTDPPGAGVDDVVDYLISQGHNRIAYIGGPDDRLQARARRLMFEKTMDAAGIRPTASIATEYAPEEAARSTSSLLDASGSRPTAIMYGSDTMAIAGISAVRKHGLRIPDDISIIGFDGLPIGAWIEPTLTTVQRDAVQRGRAAAAKLLRMLGEVTDEKAEIGRPYLVIRDSSGPAPLS